MWPYAIILSNKDQNYFKIACKLHFIFKTNWNGKINEKMEKQDT